MTSTYTPNKFIEKPANGDYVDDWDVPVNADWDVIDAAFGNTTTLNAVSASGTVTLTAAQYRSPMIVVTGALTADVNYQLPSGVGGQWSVQNNTSGAHSITFSSAGAGSTLVIAQGHRINILCDTTNVLNWGGEYASPITVTSFTAQQNFNGSSANLAASLVNAAELITSSATAASGTINLYAASQSILYYTSTASANWTINLTHAAATTFDTVLSTGQSITLSFWAQQGPTAYYNATVEVDGSTSGVTTKWLNGPPSAGTPAGVDVYTYTVVKTGSATFTVLATVGAYA